MPGGLRLASLRAFAAFLLTSLLVVWLADVALSGATLGGLTIGVLLRGTDPFRGQTVLEALIVSLGRSGALLAAALAAAAVIGVFAGAAYSLSSSRALRVVAWA